jgi:glucokinase
MTFDVWPIGRMAQANDPNADQASAASGDTRTVLLGDIGGTNSRLALAQPGRRPQHVHSYANDDFPNFQAVIRRYFEDVGIIPDFGVLALAALINGPNIALTNRDWHFHVDELAQHFGLSRVHAINDFEAFAWALTLVEPSESRAIGPQTDGAPDAAKIVLGPGTGLGVAALVPLAGGWHALPTEGGHVSIGAASDDQEQVFARLRASGSLSVEMLVSGPGLARLYAAMYPGAPHRDQKEIVTAAHASDTQACAAVALFVSLLGRFAGDMALTFKALGGVYLGGGVIPALGALFDARIFRRAFEAHPPYEKTLADVQTRLLTVEEPGLLGCSAFAKTQGRLL